MDVDIYTRGWVGQADGLKLVELSRYDKKKLWGRERMVQRVCDVEALCGSVSPDDIFDPETSAP